MENYSNNSELNCWHLLTDISIQQASTTMLLLMFINLVVLVGNFLVILTVIVNKRMRNSSSNLLITSLACSDFFLSLLVLPFCIVNHSMGFWIFGQYLCRIWLSTDVWLCTASIYNLVIITVDRFIAVTKPLSYKTVITTKRISVMISVAWLLSLVVGIPLVFTERKEISHCQCSQMHNKPSFILTSSLVSFYAPFLVIIYFYYRIYKKIRSVSSSLTKGFIDIGNDYPEKVSTTKFKPADERSLLIRNKGADYESANLRIHRGGYCTSDEKSSRKRVSSTSQTSVSVHNSIVRPRSQTWEMCSQNRISTRSSEVDISDTSIIMMTKSRRYSHAGRRHENNITRYQKRLAFELNALKTVGVVTGCFLICWFGFCLIYALRAIQNYPLSDTVVSVAAWFGYANSGINPFIYAACNHQYRRGFRRLFRRRNTLQMLSGRRTSSFSFSLSAISQQRKPSFLVESSMFSLKENV